MKKAVVLVNPYLTEESEFYQPRRIAEELRLLGVSARILPNVWTAHTERESIAEDLSREYAFAVYLDKDKYLPRMLEARGMRLFNRAEAVEICDDKMLTHIALSGKVPMPSTFPAPLCYKSGALAVEAEKVAERLGFPVVVKECFGSFGKQVYLARDAAELRALSEKLKSLPHLYQEFIAESAGRDVRAVCVGGEVVACMERRSENDFRSNLALGAVAAAYPPTEEIRALCSAVCETLRLDYCGIDFLFSEEGLLVCEVNSNAFFGGIEGALNVNVARAYARYIVKHME